MDATSSPGSSRTRRLCLELHGDFIPVARPVEHFLPPGDGDVVRFSLTFYSRRPWPSTPTGVFNEYYRYPTVDLPLSALPALRQLIGMVVSHGDQSVIRSDDHEVLEFLTDQVTSFLNDIVVERLSATGNERALYLVNAHLYIADQAAGEGPREATEEGAGASTAYLARLLRKVTYQRMEEDQGGVPETNCPICLQDFEDDEEVHLTPCGHPFHLSCLERWLRLKAECPLCRYAMCT